MATLSGPRVVSLSRMESDWVIQERLRWLIREYFGMIGSTREGSQLSCQARY